MMALFKLTADQSGAARHRSMVTLSGMGLLAAALVSGCSGGGEPWETVYAANGKLVFQGQPVAGAQLTLYPKDVEVPDSIRPTATTDADGRFQLATHSQDDGAPAGEYGVAVVWHPLVNVGAGPVRAENKLPKRYSVPDTSGLTIRIEPQVTEIPTLELKR